MGKTLSFLTMLILLSFQITAEEYTIHVLKKGETIWRIGKKYNVSLEEICKINNISDVAKVAIGAKIKIPSLIGDSTPNKTNITHKTHILKKGETIWRISKKYNVSIQEITKTNKIDDITKIKIGAKIKIPYKTEYLEYKLPLDGEINLFKTSHFNGLHIFAEENSTRLDVNAIDEGIISYIDNIPGYGITVFIKHNNNLLSTYSGLETICVKKGERVTKAQPIGLAGNLSRYNKAGILFSIQDKGAGLEYDVKEKKFVKKTS